MKNTLVAFIFFFFAAYLSSANASEYEIWVRSFIPSSHDGNPGYVETVPNHPELTMIPGPIPGFSDCFLTDQRGFSNEPFKTSRIAAYAKFNENGILVESKFIESQSVEVDCEDGDEECRETVDTSGGNISISNLGGGKIRVTMVGEASDACFTGAPDLDFSVSVEIDTNARAASYTGSIDAFPSFEGLFRIDNGPINALFRISPVDGSTAFSVLDSRELPGGTKEF
jgi:hypothetical protein